jgi:hypothetical protein
MKKNLLILLVVFFVGFKSFSQSQAYNNAYTLGFQLGVNSMQNALAYGGCYSNSWVQVYYVITPTGVSQSNGGIGFATPVSFATYLTTPANNRFVSQNILEDPYGCVPYAANLVLGDPNYQAMHDRALTLGGDSEWGAYNGYTDCVTSTIIPMF